MGNDENPPKRRGSKPGVSRGHYAISPKALELYRLYVSRDSETFGNAYRSAIKAGYPEAQAKRHASAIVRRVSQQAALSEESMSPKELENQLASIIRDPSLPARDRAFAGQVLSKVKGLQSQTIRTVNDLDGAIKEAQRRIVDAEKAARIAQDAPGTTIKPEPDGDTVH